MTTPEPSEPGRTAPVEIPAPPASPDSVAAPTSRLLVPEATSEESTQWVGRPRDAALRTDAGPSDGDRPLLPSSAAATSLAAAPDVTYVPLAVSIGDGFKFGCGFFLAAVVALLVGFVVFAALFALTSISGVNLPLGR